MTGVGPDGRSTIVSDEDVTTVARRPDGSLVMDIWRFDQLPPHVGDGDGLDGEVRRPDAGGLVYRMCTFAPNAKVDAAEYAKAIAAVYGEQAGTPGAIPGAHATDTVDVVTVVRGEVRAVLEDCEVVLRPGDNLVQRGTVHAWRNNTDEPAVVVSIMVAAQR